MKRIVISEVAGTDTLRHRETARLILSELPEEESILDFKGVSFASKSFCHELLRGLNSVKKVTRENVAPDVDRMLQIAFLKPHIENTPPPEAKRIPSVASSQV
jgi:hypothetical protein